MAINSLLGVSDLVPRGKILQIVRATDSTERTTTSATFVDASISVTITPTKSDSAVIILWTNIGRNISGVGNLQITDSSDNALSGAENFEVQGGGMRMSTAVAYSTPATTSAVTYKGRFKAQSATTQIRNDINTGQMYAIEVAA